MIDEVLYIWGLMCEMWGSLGIFWGGRLRGSVLGRGGVKVGFGVVLMGVKLKRVNLV